MEEGREGGREGRKRWVGMAWHGENHIYSGRNSSLERERFSPTAANRRIYVAEKAAHDEDKYKYKGAPRVSSFVFCKLFFVGVCVCVESGLVWAAVSVLYSSGSTNNSGEF